MIPLYRFLLWRKGFFLLIGVSVCVVNNNKEWAYVAIYIYIYIAMALPPSWSRENEQFLGTYLIQITSAAV